MVRRLLLLRHAKSSWADEGIRDRERPLNERGERDAPRVGEHIRGLDLVPARIISSTALRARTTADLVARGCGFRGEIDARDALYLASPSTLLEEASSVPDDVASVLVVAHNPGMEELVSALSGRVEPLPTAALAAFEFEIERWTDLRDALPGRCLGVWRPRELP